MDETLKAKIAALDATFDHTKPFRTAQGQPARLLGVVDHPAGPLVVAVRSVVGFEEVFQYSMDGALQSLGFSQCRILRKPYRLVNEEIT